MTYTVPIENYKRSPQPALEGSQKVWIEEELKKVEKVASTYSDAFKQIDEYMNSPEGVTNIAHGGTGGTTAAEARTNLEVPKTDGTGATGTWGISISGNAATATSATSATSATNATNATNINISATTSTDTTTSVVLVGNQATGNQSPFIDSGLTYNANTNELTATTFNGKATNLSTASGSAPVYGARAWVNFNGTGTVAINASGNVTSITDVAVGTYTVNFTTAMPDANFAGLVELGVTIGVAPTRTFSPTTSSLSVYVFNGSYNLADCENISVAIFR